jgi:DNA processing protein
MTRLDGQVELARAYLSRVAEPACLPLWALVERLGPVAAAESVRAGTAGADVLAATGARRLDADPEADLDAAHRHGIRLISPESPEWPHFAFGALHAAAERRLAEYLGGARAHRESGEPVPPVALWVQGDGELATVGVRAVGIVGSRAATQYGEHVATELGYGLARRAVVVVSGGAYGIDAAAHRGALAAGGSTVVVSAAGLDRPYPVGNRALYERAADGGLVLSESPPGMAPHRHRFLSRNRLIAALATGTVVVEAARRSGAANTAKHCVELGRPVMAVPGPVSSAMSVGCHDLIRRASHPAVLVTGIDDVLAVVGGIGEGLTEDDARTVPGDVRGELDALSATARRVFDGVPARQPATPDEIAQRSGVDGLAVLRALPELQLADLVEASDGGYRLAPRLRRRPPAGLR